MKASVIRIEIDAPAVGRLGIRGTLLMCKCSAEIAISRHEVGIEFDSPSARGLRLRKASLVEKRDSEIGVMVGVVRSKLDGSAQFRLGFR